jgi:ATP-dependent DNA helicase RecG
METEELIEIISRGEDSRHQFKTNVHNQDSLAEEFVALSNSGGGMILIGVADKTGQVNGLTAEDIHRLNNLISNAAADLVTPPVAVRTENVRHPDGLVLVVQVPNGLNKPYMDKKGVISIKVGADKRRAASREEIQRLFQQANLVHADEAAVAGLGIGDMDLPYFESFFKDQRGETLEEHGVPLAQLLTNMNLMKNGSLNVAGALLFAKAPQYHLPTFIVKAVAFPGNDIEDEAYIDSRDITGKISDMFQQTLGFVVSNLRAIQGDKSFNSNGELEIPRIVWEELLTNALIHRDYFISAPVRVLEFADRVEIISPGHLPNNLTVENIKEGNSNIRNPVLASFATKLLPYRGIGSGLLRALRAYPAIDFIDDREGNQFKVIVSRQPSNHS